MIKDIKINNIDLSKVNPDDEKFVKIVFTKDDGIDVITENVSPNQIMAAAKVLAQVAAKLWGDSND